MTVPMINDVPSLLLARFKLDRPEVIEPLVAMGWNASTTITVVRDATVFDDDEQATVPMWRLALQAQAWNVLGAWLDAPHPNPDGWHASMALEAGHAWHRGDYPLAQTVTRWLQRVDPAGHEGRLRQALVAMSDPVVRSLGVLAPTWRSGVQDGLQRW